jgi:hypothetical protein
MNKHFSVRVCPETAIDQHVGPMTSVLYEIATAIGYHVQPRL